MMFVYYAKKKKFKWCDLNFETDYFDIRSYSLQNHNVQKLV